MCDWGKEYQVGDIILFKSGSWILQYCPNNIYDEIGGGEIWLSVVKLYQYQWVKNIVFFWTGGICSQMEFNRISLKNTIAATYHQNDNT